MQMVGGRFRFAPLKGKAPQKGCPWEGESDEAQGIREKSWAHAVGWRLVVGIDGRPVDDVAGDRAGRARGRFGQ